MLKANMRSAGEHKGGERSSGDRETLDELHLFPPFAAPPALHAA
jgi:hypothetical protein